MLVGLLILGCAGPADVVDDAARAPPPPECPDPLGLELVRAWDAQALAGEEAVAYDDNRGPGLALADFTGDGWLDAFLVSPIGSKLLVNDGRGMLVVTEEAREGDRELPIGNSAAAADLDGDGDVDLAVGSPKGPPDYLLYNEGDLQFRRVDLPESGGETKTVTLADVDTDGDLDLFAAGFTYDPDEELISEGLLRGDGNALWVQGEDGTFTNAAEALPEEVRDALTTTGPSSTPTETPIPTCSSPTTGAGTSPRTCCS